MTTNQAQEMDARIRVLSIVMQELCRTMPRADSAKVAEMVHGRMAQLARGAVAADVDAATARELGPLLDALG